MICCLLALAAVLPGISVLRAALGSGSSCHRPATTGVRHRDAHVAIGSAGVAMVVVGTMWFGHAMIHRSAMMVSGVSAFEEASALTPICRAIDRAIVR